MQVLHFCLKKEDCSETYKDHANIARYTVKALNSGHH